MNAWVVAAAVMLGLLLPAGLLTMRGDVIDRVVAMQLSTTIAALALLLLAEAADRDVYFDLAVVTTVLSFVGSLFYLRSLEAWL